MENTNQTHRKLLNSELGRISPEEYSNTPKLPIIVVLDNIRSQHNIGSVFRTCDAFLVDEVYLCGICAIPPSPEIHKSALGAENSVKWHYFKETNDAIESLKELGYIIVSVEQAENSISLDNFHPKPNMKYVFVFGNEVKGVNQSVVDMSDLVLEIPQSGTKHSLNISVSVGAVLWEVYKHLK